MASKLRGLVRASTLGPASITLSEKDQQRERPLQLLVATWNVGNAMPKATELAWLPEGGGEYDMIVIGTQENAFSDKEKRSSTKESFESVAAEDEDDDEDAEERDLPTPLPKQRPRRRFSLGSAKSTRESFSDVTNSRVATRAHGGWGASSQKAKKRASTSKQPHAWDAMCAQRLGDGWCACAHVVLREMRLTVYCTRALAERDLTLIRTAYSATGIGGVIGNKGGLVARLHVGNTTLAFCSCHLAAHEGAAYLNRRNQMSSEVLSETMSASGSRPLDIAHSADHVIWLGDLNYRIDLGLSGVEHEKSKAGHAAHVAAVRDLIEAKQWGSLAHADELNAVRARGDAFVGFREGDYPFPPTFKVERAPGVSYKAQRTPSYCDRILWKSMPPCEGQLALRWICAIAEVSTSDHKPVVAAFGLSPTAPIRQSTSNQVVVRVSDLALRDIVASDWTGTSDPFCCFFTHPDGLLTDYFTPKTSVKYRVRPGQQSVATGDAKLARSLTKQLSRMQSSPVIKGMMGSKPLCRWADKEVPQLVMNVSIDHLDQACLLIGIFDFDRFTVRCDGTWGVRPERMPRVTSRRSAARQMPYTACHTTTRRVSLPTACHPPPCSSPIACQPPTHRKSSSRAAEKRPPRCGHHPACATDSCGVSSRGAAGGWPKPFAGGGSSKRFVFKGRQIRHRQCPEGLKELAVRCLGFGVQSLCRSAHHPLQLDQRYWPLVVLATRKSACTHHRTVQGHIQILADADPLAHVDANVHALHEESWSVEVDCVPYTGCQVLQKSLQDSRCATSYLHGGGRNVVAGVGGCSAFVGKRASHSPTRRSTFTSGSIPVYSSVRVVSD